MGRAVSALSDAAEAYRLAREQLAHAVRELEHNAEPDNHRWLDYQVHERRLALEEAAATLRQAAAARWEYCD